MAGVPGVPPDGASIQIEQYGRVQVPRGLYITSLTRSLKDLERRKDGKPAFNELISLYSGADVVVVGGTPAGLASAVAAARMGSSVVVLEPTAHVGGIVSNGLTNADTLKRQAVGGIFYEFTPRVLAYYRDKYGANSSQAKACRGGYCYDPKVAERIFLEMLVGEGERIRVYYRVTVHGNSRNGSAVSAGSAGEGG